MTDGNRTPRPPGRTGRTSVVPDGTGLATSPAGADADADAEAKEKRTTTAATAARRTSDLTVSPTALNPDFESPGLITATLGSQFDGLTSPIGFEVISQNPGSGPLAIYSSLALNGTVAAVPEPTSLSLLGIGATALLGRRRSGTEHVCRFK